MWRRDNYFWWIGIVLLFFGFLFSQNNLLVNGDLETVEPAFWNKLNDGLGGSQLFWASDTAAPNNWNTDLPSTYSFKIVKSSTTTDEVGWMSVNNADLYWNNAGFNDSYDLWFWAKTEGVNTAPSTDDEKIGVWFKFYANGVELASQFVPVDQSTASTKWTKYTGTVAGILMTSEPDSVVAIAVMGKNATGTVWFDNIDCNTQSGWSMGMFNGDAETPVGWLQWSSTTEIGYVNMIEDPNAHSGNHSVLLKERDDNADEIVFYSEPVPVQAGKWYLISGWVKTDSINTDPKWYPTNVIKDRDNDRMGYTFFYHRSPLRTAWDLTEGDQFFYIDQRDSSSGWTYYAVVSQAPTDAEGLSMRARFTSFPKGYAWYDDFSIKELKAVITSIVDPAKPFTNLSFDYELLQNYPNPFNPETIIEFKVPKAGPVKLEIFNVLGQKIRTLVNANYQPGKYRVIWNGLDDSGTRVATGVYLYQLRADNALITKKMLLVK